jgi:arginine-tRNA-protein transferase
MVQSLFFKGSYLDKLLAEGKYRMNNQMTTCDYIITENVELLNVIWARYLVYEVKDLLKHKIYKNAKKFKVTITDFILTDEIRELAQKYCDSRKIEVTFEDTYFLNEENINPFETKTLLVHDGDKLIAVGYFDEGLDAIMGLKNIFDPDYAKYSLGKLIMIYKMQYCIEHQISYYYPGYIACESDIFDYKLFFQAESIELKINGYWINFAHFESKQHACDTQVMKYELRRREDNLDEGNTDSL